MNSEYVKNLMHRAVNITHSHKLSHLSSVLNAIPVLAKIYAEKSPLDRVVLSAGHAGLAQYVVLESLNPEKVNLAEDLLVKHGIHPCTDPENGITISTGSLGSGLPIAVGIAMADHSSVVHCVLTDGECAEGSVWESLRYINVHELNNITVHVIVNGQSAYEYLNREYLINRLETFLPNIEIHKASSYITDEIYGLLAHYRVMTDLDEQKIHQAIDAGDL